MELILSHLIGDYVLQNNWMANNKTTKSLAALVHVIVYTLPFLILVDMQWQGYVVIALTHFLIDRWRLARYWCRFFGVGTAAFYEKDVETPPFLSVWLMIIVDNTFHLTINWICTKVFS